MRSISRSDLTKIIGCGLGAKVCGYTNLQATKIGVGMISRGEVALIVANKGAAVGLMVPEFFGPILIVVVVTTIITPILLKLIYRYQAAHVGDPVIDSSLVDRYREKHEIEMLTQNALNMHEELRKDIEVKNKNKTNNKTNNKTK